MTDNQDRLDAIKHILATLFAAQNALKALAPDYKWAGMGNLLGDYGEFVCVEHYELTKAPAGASGYDAITPDGQTVQIKTCYASSQIGFRGEADLLLVIQVQADGTWEEVYFGPFGPILDGARYSARDNKHTMTLSKLKRRSHEG
ncbi:DUF6998 domain-containing protein [Oceanicaulis sp. UBA2681]|uniref:DUF6998 domain-containing protein n=1 Tax=Oceanicaulis sp. UBA2681 TaxID=1947007 RepID=UPI0025807FEB|nr:hypothetical protein [Oceanicaulis sp. UBA2681]